MQCFVAIDYYPKTAEHKNALWKLSSLYSKPFQGAPDETTKYPILPYNEIISTNIPDDC